tara:strand:- start:1441 stop:2283 length:843 start_codon:yes stop_codon:yes gene_type:complete
MISKNAIIESKEITIGKNVTIGDNVEIKCPEYIKIGDNSVITNNVKINCTSFEAGEYLFMCERVEVGRGGCYGPNSRVKIGKHVGIFEGTIINPSEMVEIGDDVGIGGDVMIWTHGAWLDALQGFPEDFGPVKLGNNVWLPARSIVLPNVNIGNNVVIGINSIINRSLPDGCFAAGSPCKVIKEDVYPKPLSTEAIEKLVVDILDNWKKLIEFKGVTRPVDVNYENGKIFLNQSHYKTIYDIQDKTMNGYINDVAEDLRDYMRRRGIKIYNGEPFKSIKL